jgi:tetratricopeptide (TPR) repeat protein
MPKTIFILLFSLCLPNWIKAQDIHQIKRFSDEQFEKGNYHLALKEYQRILFFNAENEYDELYSRIASIHYMFSDFDLAVKYYDFAMRIENDDSIRFELALKKALCNFKQNNYFSALAELLDLSDPPGEYLQKKKNLYTGICYFGLKDYNSSRYHFAEVLDTGAINELNILFDSFARINKKYRPGKVELMSILIPGLGQIYTGEILSGLNSFILITGITFYAAVTAINYSLIDGLLVLSSWFYRYYSGGFTNAHDAAVRKIEWEKTKTYSEILSLIERYQFSSSE